MRGAAANGADNFRPTAVEGEQGVVQVSAELGSMLALAAQQIQGGNGGPGLLPVPAPAAGALDGEVWETPPPEAMEPMDTSRSIPTSKACLEKIPRIVIDERSAVLHEATLTEQGQPTLDCCVGEFGMNAPYAVEAELVAADPIFGAPAFVNAASLAGKVVLVKRGKDISFATKAIQAQSAGAIAVVVVQNVPVWP
jgi:hypothetical protein